HQLFKLLMSLDLLGFGHEHLCDPRLAPIELAACVARRHSLPDGVQVRAALFTETQIFALADAALWTEHFQPLLYTFPRNTAIIDRRFLLWAVRSRPLENNSTGDRIFCYGFRTRTTRRRIVRRTGDSRSLQRSTPLVHRKLAAAAARRDRERARASGLQRTGRATAGALFDGLSARAAAEASARRGHARARVAAEAESTDDRADGLRQDVSRRVVVPPHLQTPHGRRGCD